jgi:hypothetical protein
MSLPFVEFPDNFITSPPESCFTDRAHLTPGDPDYPLAGLFAGGTGSRLRRYYLPYILESGMHPRGVVGMSSGAVARR